MQVSYREFEERFRGSSATVRAQQQGYLDCFEGVAGPVVDLGCGRGEMVALLCERGHAAYGVEADAEMRQVAVDRGLEVRHEDLLEHLRALEEASLGGVFMAHVIEHLPKQAVLELTSLLGSKVRPGGVVVLETLNPACWFAMAPFFMDLTHQWPIHPLTLQYLLEAHGYGGFEVRYQQYLPDTMLALPQRPAHQAESSLERDFIEAMQKLQVIVDLSFRNFIYAVVARRLA
jgi:SAM-dependent methyltransferase